MILAARRGSRILVLAAAMTGIGCSTLAQTSGDRQSAGSQVPPAPTLPTVPVAQQCDIAPAIDWMAEQRIIYTQSPSDEWRDCSGNFLRLSSRIASICPGLQLAAPPGISPYMNGGNNKRPGLEEARSTRGLARWYDDKGMFIPIFYDGTDPLDAPASLVRLRNRITTGTVLWFSPAVPSAAAGKPALYAEQGGVINHMGTVVSVTRDEAGNVTGWDMYHGQNPRMHNGVTSHFWARSGRSRPVPQGGYGSQRIVGFAESIIPGTPLQN